MVSLVDQFESVCVTRVSVTDDSIDVALKDGRSISIPTKWYPRLFHATPEEREEYEIDSHGIVWPAIEADISIRGILLGKKSGESPASLKFWLNGRKRGQNLKFEDFMRHLRCSRSLHKRGVKVAK
jgi:hypothetical protein